MHDLSNKITWKKKKMYLIYKIYSLSWNVLSVRCFSMECLIFKMSFYETRLWGRFAAISFFNCEHFLFVYIVIQKKSSRIFKIYWKSSFYWTQIFEISIIHKPSLGPHNIWARLVWPFWRLLETNRQTCKVFI